MTFTPNSPIPEVPADGLTYCAVHPDRETALRCNRCERYMCVECAVQTPVGYRCKECVRGLEDRFYTATTNDALTVFVVCAGLAAIAGGIAGAVRIPLLFVLILGLPVGGAIAEAALRVTQRRRARQSDKLAAAGVVVGGFSGALVQAMLYIGQLAASRNVDVGFPLDAAFTLVFRDFGALIFIVMMGAAAYSRFKMRI